MKDIQNSVNILRKYNDAYRSGNPIISDKEYDYLVEKLRKIDPNNPFLYTVEPEQFYLKKQIRHPYPMLSIEKAYTKEQLEKFIARVQKKAADIGINEVDFLVMPKLDGIAGRDDGKIFATRGNGEVGYEISSVFYKGVIAIGGRGKGLGEIVVVKSYFDKFLSDKFEHPRNMVAGIVASDTANELAQKALEDKVVHFVPYTSLSYWIGNASELFENIEQTTTELAKKTDYPIDGIVTYVTDEKVKKYMGATSHHYRWQIAIKTKGKTAETKVEDIIWQVGRSGNITPVLAVSAISLSGATIKRITAHHAGLVKKMRVGVGAKIEVIRSGEVIPKLEKVVNTSEKYNIPEKCPSCNSLLVWNNDFLRCTNYDCKAQIEKRISHWFKMLDNADWFGIKTIQKLVDRGYDEIEKIYAMSESEFIDIGFGLVQSKNLAKAIEISQTKPVEDWRFLSAFGISNLGKGDSRKLLSHIKLEEVVNVETKTIEKIPSFGLITSNSIADGIKKISDKLVHMLSLGFNIIETPLITEIQAFENIVLGKRIVFTGKMQYGTRDEMQAEARKFGAVVQTYISGKTDYLVCGEKVGSKKVNDAEKLGVKIIDEKSYLQMLRKSF